jgi:hypothetical protein
MRLPRGSILRIPERRGPETALLHKATNARESRTATEIQLVKCTTVDEQHASTHGCRLELHAQLSWRNPSTMGELPARWSTQTDWAATRMSHHML